MSIFGFIIIFFISLLHFYIMYLEMFSWTSKKTQKIFKTTKDFAEKTKVLAANQGLYNGFLAVGLMISLFFNFQNIILSKIIAFIFLSFIFFAGVYGGLTSNKKIFYIQSIPSIIAILLLF